MNPKRLSISLVILITLFFVNLAGAHCEIPCGIYDDNLRVKLIAEHITTIEKSMKQILELSKQSPVNYNQIVRWIDNKEKHAGEIQHVVTQYFMTQRIKPDSKKYTDKLQILHKILQSAMKCKQTTDLLHTKTLRSLLKDFEMLYFGHSHD